MNMFQSREQLEVFVRQNPRRFLEYLEGNQNFRNDFQTLLQEWNQSDIIKIASLLQGYEARDIVTNKIMVVDKEAQNFVKWATIQNKELRENGYHQITSFQSYLNEKRIKETEEEERLLKRRREQINRNNEKEKEEKDIKAKILLEQSIINNIMFNKVLNHLENQDKNNLLANKDLIKLIKNNFSEEFNNYYNRLQKFTNDDSKLNSVTTFAVFLEQAIKTDSRAIFNYLKEQNLLSGIVSQLKEKYPELNNLKDKTPLEIEKIIHNIGSTENGLNDIVEAIITRLAHKGVKMENVFNVIKNIEDLPPVLKQMIEAVNSEFNNKNKLLANENVSDKVREITSEVNRNITLNSVNDNIKNSIDEFNLVNKDIFNKQGIETNHENNGQENKYNSLRNEL